MLENQPHSLRRQPPRLRWSSPAAQPHKHQLQSINNLMRLQFRKKT